MPWQVLIDLIEPHYPKASQKGGRPPYPLATMLRVHLLQQWYSLSDQAMDEALLEVPTRRRSSGIELINDRSQADNTIRTFPLVLANTSLTRTVFEVVKDHHHNTPPPPLTTPHPPSPVTRPRTPPPPPRLSTRPQLVPIRGPQISPIRSTP